MSQPPGGSFGDEPNANAWSQQPGQPNSGGSPSPGYHSPQAPTPPAATSAGGLKSLFDFSFTTYATPSIIRIVYILLTVLIALGTLFVFVSGLSQLGNSRTAVGGFVVIILAPLAGLVYLAIARISLEASVALVRAATELRAIREQGQRH